ncbi:MAG: ABC transporter substrate-binding protein [Alphaproteobacteria bacterium]|nr:ABC transporter substrate-binding protein [Alphaproteobacteria bacterium]
MASASTRWARTALLILGLAAFVPGADARTLRFGNDGDANSMDPHSRNETFLLAFTHHIYEPLVRRNRALQLEGALATSWRQVEPTRIRIQLRPNVVFHDGTPFDADDVVFSIERAAGPGSNLQGHFASFQQVAKVDPLTVEFVTKYPDPVFVDKLSQIAIMSKAWSEKHGAQRSADLTKREENYATRNANGTGPFMLKSREPDVKTVLVVNPKWWDKPEHNLTEIEFSVVANDATRVAALLSGNLDFVYTVPPQDVARIAQTPGLKILQGPELRIVYFGFDQARDELLESNVKGKNPFKDVRVRRAFFQAIDVEAIRNRVMRGQSTPTALMIAPGLNGYMKEVDRRPPYDPEAARRLLAEAGYPNGFEVGMDCPNDRYINDEQICQASVAMLARIGVKVNLNAQTRAKYFAKILGPQFNTSFYMLGWTPGATYDVHNVFEPLMQTRNAATRKGAFNVGGWSNKRFDELTDLIEQETDKTKRDAMIAEAHRIHIDDVSHIPLHQQALVWAVRANVEIPQPADNWFALRYAQIK